MGLFAREYPVPCGGPKSLHLLLLMRKWPEAAEDSDAQDPAMTAMSKPDIELTGIFAHMVETVGHSREE